MDWTSNCTKGLHIVNICKRIDFSDVDSVKQYGFRLPGIDENISHVESRLEAVSMFICLNRSNLIQNSLIYKCCCFFTWGEWKRVSQFSFCSFLDSYIFSCFCQLTQKWFAIISFKIVLSLTEPFMIRLFPLISHVFKTKLWNLDFLVLHTENLAFSKSLSRTKAL